MKLLEEFNKVKAENKKCIVFVKSGAFHISLGIDAYILNHILKLKLTDIPNTKRVGIPINSIEKYIGLRYEEKLNLICDKLKKEYTILENLDYNKLKAQKYFLYIL